MTYKNLQQFSIIGLLLLFCFISINLNAQSDNQNNTTAYKGHMMLSGGFAKPLEDLASNSIYGNAKRGAGIQFLFQFPFTKYIGFCADFHREVFFVDEDAIFKRSGSYTLPYVTGYVSSVSVSKNWSVNGLQAGIYANLPLSNNNLVFETRLMLGACKAGSPGFSTTYATFSPTTASTTYLTESQSSSNSNNFPLSFLLGFGLRLNVHPDWCLGVHFDYLNMIPETEFEEITWTNTKNVSSTEPKQWDMGYYTLRIGIGRMIGN